MADLEDAVPAEQNPDLSDLTLVILNVETREGRQLSMVWGEAEGPLSIDQALGYGSDEAGNFDTWTITLTQRRP